MSGLAADEILSELRREPYTFLVGVPTIYRTIMEAAKTTGLQAL